MSVQNVLNTENSDSSLDSQLLRLLHPVIAGKGFTSVATEFLSQLNTLLSCERISIGFLVGKAVKLAAISGHYQKIDLPVLPKVTAAMEEVIIQGISLIYPQPADTFPHITVAHSMLAKENGLQKILTIPILLNEQIVGAITMESQRDNFHHQEHIAFIEKLISNIGPLLTFKWRQEQPLWFRCKLAARNYFSDSQEKSAKKIKLGIFSTLGILLLLLLAIPITNNVSGQARLDASIQRVISSPIDGFLKEVHVRPGDHVKANQLLAELNDESIISQRRQLKAEAAQQENSLADAVVKGDRTQTAVYRAKLDQVNAQLELIEQQLSRTQLTAPFDGVVIKGDLQQMLGAPLKRSDALLTVSQGNDFRVIVNVDERDISDIKIGQTGKLLLPAYPGKQFPVKVIRITPVAATADGQNTFEVETSIDADSTGLSPGLKGVAKITVNHRPLGWKWISHTWNAVHYFIWSKLG